MTILEQLRDTPEFEAAALAIEKSQHALQLRVEALEQAAREVVETFMQPCGNHQCKPCNARANLGRTLVR